MENPNAPQIINGKKVFAKCPYCKSELIIVAEQENNACVDCNHLIENKKCLACRTPLVKGQVFCSNCLIAGKDKTLKRDISDL
jgi:hypothetical protein